jgi:hypothetical protein
VIEAVDTLTMIKRYRDQLGPYYAMLIDYFKDGLIYNCNLICIVRLIAKLTLFQDIDYTALQLDAILFDLFFNQIEVEKTAVGILMKTNPDFMKRYEGLSKEGTVAAREVEGSALSDSDSVGEDEEYSQSSLG